jgi:DNA-binding transcriptional ArsR family regulator
MRETEEKRSNAEGRAARPAQEEPGPIPLLAATAPASLQSLLSQTLQALAAAIGDEGARVLIVGICRTPSGEVRTWYELFSEKAVEKLLMPELIRALEALASPERLKLMLALSRGKAGSAELMETAGLTQGQFYHHLRALEASGLVRKRGRDEYEITLHGTSALFTFLAAAAYIHQGLVPETVQEEGEGP